MSYDEEWIDIDVRIEHKTQEAVLVSDGDTAAWIPKSLVQNWDEDWGPGDTVSIEVPTRVAEERGLV